MFLLKERSEIVGVVYSHDNSLIIGDETKPYSCRVSRPEGMHYVIAETNEIGEVLRYVIELNNRGDHKNEN
ncbi:hypothetical protein [Lysinibacillus endophyticus]|uniref:hypothetical protein n=1 Tax=Ureibacillus endophyticus TaxID=1978490 RepID=UPI00209F604C|nr:hypothetical protein [Lysinibacillus endophyticus]MCP1145801.1 hypothetical protein [Lysinibacillus endophyticus]